MVVGALCDDAGRARKSLVMVFIIIIVSISPVLNQEEVEIIKDNKSTFGKTSGETTEIWTDGNQPWPQFGRTSDKKSHVPLHSPEGGAGFGDPENATELKAIVDPQINWQYGSYSIGTDSLATPIANLQNSIIKDIEADERCGKSSLFIIIIQTEQISGDDHSFLRIIEGEDADLAWQVDLGATESVKASPVIVDIDDDGKQEILVTYDAGGAVFVEAWSPRLSCSVTGWSTGGHSAELLWTWSDETLRISSNEGPYTSEILGNHNPTTQPLLADLDLDGDAELVLSLIDEITDNPVVLALPLPSSNSPSPIWQVTLSKGSHPSDPSFALTDDSTGYVLLTTIEANNGGMWVWKIDSETGDSSWEDGFSLNNIDGDNDVPHIRLPGPIIVNLDSDAVPEMIITIPTDADGSNGADGAEYRGLEISDGEEIWSFNAANGYADAPPTAIDTDEDDIYDRICWITWWQTTTARHGEVGCHDVGGTIPNQIWNNDLEQSSGNPNDEIAVSAVTWMDINGDEEEEILVAFGRSLWAFDGEEGTSSAISTEWTNEVDLSHRTWSSPSLADIDGDATLDIVIGNMVVSTSEPDIRPLSDGRSIEFNPNAPDPGEIVTVTALFENIGTADTEEGVDAVLYANGNEIGRYRTDNMQPVNPTGPGTFESFNVEWSGNLGEHTFELRLDPFRNITQSRYDNDLQIKTLSIVPTYNASFEISTEPIRVNPGESVITMPTIRSTGRLAGIWSLDIDSTNMPSGWSWDDATEEGLMQIEIGADSIWNPKISINAPLDALGSDSGFLILKLTLDDDVNISVTANLPLEANRTRGLSLRGPDGTSYSEGYGLLGSDASAWFIIENVGNAAENQIAMSWDSTDWGSNLKLFNSMGTEENAIVIGPGEIKEMTARLAVPSNSEYGDTVSTPLTMCVGSGEEEICQTITLTFVSSGVIVETRHQRSVPSDNLEWTVTADMPLDQEYLNWSLINSGMEISGWQWELTGQISIVGDKISMTGDPGSRVVGKIYLDLPDDASPGYHLFNNIEETTDFRIKFSLEVLQIYRANLTIVSPVEMPSSVDVEKDVIIMLRLENPGNGADTYELSHRVILDENVTNDIGITVIFSNNPVLLGAGSLRTIPVAINLPSTTPARVEVNIEITMVSVGDKNVKDAEVVILEAKQDHKWEINTLVEGSNISEEIYQIEPGGYFQVDVLARNIGNMVDDLTLETDVEVFYESGDASIGWLAAGEAISGIVVNETVSMKINSTIPKDAWVGSKMIVTTTAISLGEEVHVFVFEVGAKHKPGWNVLASGAELEIDANGSEVELTIVQLGNMESRPYVSVWVIGEEGWIIELPEELPLIEPDKSTSMILNVTPSENSQYGRAVELNIRVREGDSSVVSEVTLPLRVAAIHNFTMIDYHKWEISDHGGHPLVSLENLGNAPTTISLQILSLPQDWSIKGSDTIVLAAGEKSGLPLEIIPSQDWNGDVKTIRILANNSEGIQREIVIDTLTKEYSWMSSPIINALSGDDAIINIHGTDYNSSIVDDSGNNLQWTEQGWLLPASGSGFGNITINQNIELRYMIETYQIPQRDVVCIISGDIGDIHASCSIDSGNDSFTYSILLIDDQGKILDIKHNSLSSNEQTIMINLSSEDWNPEPGVRELMIKIVDSKGMELSNFEKDFEIRRSNWNIGLTSVDLIGTGENQVIEVTAERFGHGQLLEADCTISLAAGNYQSTQKIDMSTRVILTPKPKFERPMEVEDEIEIIVRIECLFPWDLDSNQGDNEIRKVLTGGSVNEENFNYGESMVAALVIIIISLSLAWVSKNRREMREFEELTRVAIEQKKKRMEDSKENEIPKEESEILDESFQSEEYMEIKEDDAPEVEEEILDEFERRLKRIRRDE